MRIVFMGDSTMQQNYASTYPQVGWPQALPLFLNKDVEYLNFARNGCSTKSFQDLGYYQKALDALKKGDYCFIQFGHNDQKKDNFERYASPTEYYSNLVKFVNDVKEKEAIPVILSPIYRRYFDSEGKVIDNVHFEYPSIAKSVSEDEKVTFVDATKLTKELYSNLGDEESKRLFMHLPKGIYSNYPNGLEDNTHLKMDGAYEISNLIIKELKKINHPISQYVKLEVND